MHMLYEVMT